MRKLKFKFDGVVVENSCSRSSSSRPYFDDTEMLEFEEELDMLLANIETVEAIEDDSE